MLATKGWVYAVAWSPDSKSLASAGKDGTVRLWHVESGQMVRTLPGHPKTIRALAWSPDGKIVASGKKDGTVQLRDTESGRVLRTLQPDREPLDQSKEHLSNTLAWSPDGQTLAYCGDSSVSLWDVESGR